MKRLLNYLKENWAIIIAIAFVAFLMCCTIIPWFYGAGRVAWEWATAETVVMP